MDAMMDITAWSALSAFGPAERFADAIRAGRPAPAAVEPAGPPGLRACLVPGFDQREALGRKGTKGMDRVTGLAVAAVGSLLGPRPGAGRDPDVGLVLGTTSGSVQSTMNLTRASLTGERPFDVEPADIPSTVMNCAAGQCAIWHGITGPNTTIAGGRAAGLLGLAYARRLMLAGRARTVLCGGAEECSPARSWLEFHGGPPGAPPAVLGEGAAMLRLEPAGAPGSIATVLAVESQLSEDTDAPAAVTAVTWRALLRAGLAPARVRAVLPGSAAERDSLAVIFEPDVLRRVPLVADLLGQTGAASAVFQVAAGLGVLAGEPGGPVVVVTSADPAGMTAAAVLRLAAPAPEPAVA